MRPPTPATRKPAALGPIEAGDGPGTFQFTDMDHQPTDDPVTAMAAYVGPAGTGCARLAFACPRTGQPCGGIIVGHDRQPELAPSWSWNGELDAPTVTPALECFTCNARRDLVNGQFVYLGMLIDYAELATVDEPAPVPGPLL